MKIMIKGIFPIVAGLLLTSAVSSFAIEGLQVSLQSSNVVLSWPSLDSQNYIVQYRPSLTSTSSWLTLTSSLPGDSGTNFTFYVHSNAAQYSSIIGGTNGGGGSIDPGSTNSSSGGTNVSVAVGFGFYRVVQDGVRLLDSSIFTLDSMAGDESE